jgi:endonuclease/exonuclease/phosphatase family metal-dependent hydrolase
VTIRVLTYNLFWWNLFGRRGGNGRSAGRLIESNGHFDILGFQECDSVQRILDDARLSSSHVGLQGPHALGMAYAHAVWEKIGEGKADVAEDRHDQYYGKRGVQWVRLSHKATGRTVFFINHHGPLPVNTGGKCGGTAAASSMLRVVSENMLGGDKVVLMGDLNADTSASTQKKLSEHLYRSVKHWVDAVYSSCPAVDSANLGTGGSDHNALSATLPL